MKKDIFKNFRKTGNVIDYLHYASQKKKIKNNNQEKETTNGINEGNNTQNK